MQIIYMLIVSASFLSAFSFAYAGQGISNSNYILSESGTLKLMSFNEGNIVDARSLIHDKYLTNSYWPCIDIKSNQLYFEYYGDSNHTPMIYSLDLNDVNRQAKKLYEGRFPSLSPNGHMLSYYVHPNKLFVVTLGEESSIKQVSTEIPNGAPAVWISNNKLIYMNLNKRLIVLDVSTGENIDTGHSEVIPGSTISSDGDRVICGSYDGKKIFIYHASTNELDILLNNHVLSIGAISVWSQGEKGFYYTRQTLNNILKIDESQELFFYSIAKNKEVPMQKKMALFGGVFWR